MKNPKNRIQGVLTALVTPFVQGEVDYKSFRKLIRYQLDQGVQGFVINGTTAESPCLTFTEVEELFTLAKVEVAGQVPLIIGTGLNSTVRTIELSRACAGWGADAQLVVVPYYNRPPQRGLIAHFTEVAEQTNLPVILYNVPSRTVASLEMTTLATLSRINNICGIKEASGQMQSLVTMMSTTPPEFIKLSGDDATCIDFCAGGGHGVISVSSHIIGAEMIELMHKAKTPGSDAVTEYQRKYSELLKWLYIEANPIPVKAALYWMGIIESPELRLPLMELDANLSEGFKACLKKLGKI